MCAIDGPSSLADVHGILFLINTNDSIPAFKTLPVKFFKQTLLCWLDGLRFRLSPPKAVWRVVCYILLPAQQII